MKEILMFNTNRHKLEVTERDNILLSIKPLDSNKWKTIFCFWKNEGDIELLKKAIKI